MHLGAAMHVNVAQAGAPQRAELPGGRGSGLQRVAELSCAGAHLGCQAPAAIAQAQAAARLARLGAQEGIIEWARVFTRLLAWLDCMV